MGKLFKRIFGMWFLSVFLSACSQEVGPQDYLRIAGGGFVFNLRYSQAYYVFVAQQNIPLPVGSILEASFDVPGQTKRFVVKENALPGKLQYKFQSEQLLGIKKDHAYKVTLRLIDGTTGTELDKDEAVYRSDVDQSELPTAPPVVGLDLNPVQKY